MFDDCRSSADADGQTAAVVQRARPSVNDNITLVIHNTLSSAHSCLPPNTLLFQRMRTKYLKTSVSISFTFISLTS